MKNRMKKVAPILLVVLTLTILFTSVCSATDPVQITREQARANVDAWLASHPLPVYIDPKTPDYRDEGRHYYFFGMYHNKTNKFIVNILADVYTGKLYVNDMQDDRIIPIDKWYNSI